MNFHSRWAWFGSRRDRPCAPPFARYLNTALVVIKYNYKTTIDGCYRKKKPRRLTLHVYLFGLNLFVTPTSLVKHILLLIPYFLAYLLSVSVVAAVNRSPRHVIMPLRSGTTRLRGHSTKATPVIQTCVLQRYEIRAGFEENIPYHFRCNLPFESCSKRYICVEITVNLVLVILFTYVLFLRQYASFFRSR